LRADPHTILRAAARVATVVGFLLFAGFTLDRTFNDFPATITIRTRLALARRTRPGFAIGALIVGNPKLRTTIRVCTTIDTRVVTAVAVGVVGVIPRCTSDGLAGRDGHARTIDAQSVRTIVVRAAFIGLAFLVCHHDHTVWHLAWRRVFTTLASNRMLGNRFYGDTDPLIVFGRRTRIGTGHFRASPNPTVHALAGVATIVGFFLGTGLTVRGAFNDFPATGLVLVECALAGRSGDRLPVGTVVIG